MVVIIWRWCASTFSRKYAAPAFARHRILWFPYPCHWNFSSAVELISGRPLVVTAAQHEWISCVYGKCHLHMISIVKHTDILLWLRRDCVRLIFLSVCQYYFILDCIASFESAEERVHDVHSSSVRPVRSVSSLVSIVLNLSRKQWRCFLLYWSRRLSFADEIKMKFMVSSNWIYRAGPPPFAPSHNYSTINLWSTKLFCEIYFQYESSVSMKYRSNQKSCYSSQFCVDFFFMFLFSAVCVETINLVG